LCVVGSRPKRREYESEAMSTPGKFNVNMEAQTVTITLTKENAMKLSTALAAHARIIKIASKHGIWAQENDMKTYVNFGVALCASLMAILAAWDQGNLQSSQTDMSNLIKALGDRIRKGGPGDQN